MHDDSRSDRRQNAKCRLRLTNVHFSVGKEQLKVGLFGSSANLLAIRLSEVILFFLGPCR